MASTRQLRGGDFVLRCDQEELDILAQGIQKVMDTADFTKVPPDIRDALEGAYQARHRRVSDLKTKLESLETDSDGQVSMEHATA